MTPIHIIKLAVGIDSLSHFHQVQQGHLVEYQGKAAVPCWTRTMPKQADEILRSGSSIYRVIHNKIQCRHRILGFETVETEVKGTMTVIMQDAEMIRTVPVPRRPFQGWRYLKAGDAPEDMGVYDGRVIGEGEDSAELQAALHEAGLL